ncbi:MAG: hypothetical protein U9M98_00920 [Patescibacteria group bacterium]|nr:hypothetical protein [Patescibacteria group bacterium]
MNTGNYPKLKIEYDISRDVKNYLAKRASYAQEVMNRKDFFGYFSKHLPQEIITCLKNKKLTKEEKGKILERTLKEYYKKKQTKL